MASEHLPWLVCSTINRAICFGTHLIETVLRHYDIYMYVVPRTATVWHLSVVYKLDGGDDESCADASGGIEHLHGPWPRLQAARILQQVQCESGRRGKRFLSYKDAAPSRRDSGNRPRNSIEDPC